MRCQVCRERAVIDVRRHNADYCAEHFVRLCRDQVAKSIDQFAMFGPQDRLLVAVSGGKDSLALWEILRALGYEADGVYIGLGIDDYSDASQVAVERFARQRGWPLRTIDLRAEHGFDVPAAAAATRRVPCSACGLSKRHLFDAATLEGGYDALVTGHNLDDEAAVLFGNALRWNEDHLGRQHPVLAEGSGFPRKVKPLVRLGERETAAYCVLQGIDYQVEECPMAAGNKHLGYKEALNQIEETSPGAKAAFYFGFLERAAPRFRPDHPDHPDHLDQAAPTACERCGAPCNGDRCAFCHLVARTTGAEPVRLTVKEPS